MKHLICALLSVPAFLATVPAGAEGQDDAIRRANGKIQFANYPQGALRRGEEGTVGIRVKTDQKGRLMECDVVKTSGYRSLDEASCEFLLRYGRAKPFLSPDGRTVAQVQDGEVVWTLPEGRRRGGAAAVKTASASAPGGERQICKMQGSTGSNVRSQRICMTLAEWQRQRDGAQQDLESMRPRYVPGQ